MADQERIVGPMKIETGIPVPPVSARPAKYPLARMAIGDSFHVEGDATVAKRVRTSVSHSGQRTGRRYVTRKTDTGIRVWRVE